MGFVHAHVSGSRIVVHNHALPTAPSCNADGASCAEQQRDHTHEEDILGVVPEDAHDGREEGCWHEHILGDGRGSLRVRHRHPGAEKGHDHNVSSSSDPPFGPESALIGAPEDTLLVPLQPRGWRVVFPAWQRSHPWWHIWPISELKITHAKAHFNSSGVDDAWPGGLTIVTQGFKLILGIAAWYWGREDSSASDNGLKDDLDSGFRADGTKNMDSFYFASLYAVAGIAAALTACWFRIWWHSPVNVLFTLANYLLYINGWILSVLTLYDRLEPTYNIPAHFALLPVLVPPAYVTLRTVLFFPSATRRKRFLLAALSNRSVPLEMNLHVVGPADTNESHGFLVMLNSYAMIVTLLSKLVVFSFSSSWASDFGPEHSGPESGGMEIGEVLAHLAHLLSTVWASVYAIRCRQLALDCYEMGTGICVDKNTHVSAAAIGNRRTGTETP